MKYKKITFSKGQILMFSICLCLLIGILLGAIGANSMNEMQYTELGNYLNGFLNKIKQEGVMSQNYADVVVKYGKYALLIWLCGFIAPGAVFIYMILIFRGVGYGFTTALLVKQYGKVGISFAALSYLPQNIILIPAYIGIAFVSMQYILKKFQKLPPKARLQREKQKTNLEYIIIFMGEFMLVAAASAVEVYVIPILLSF